MQRAVQEASRVMVLNLEIPNTGIRDPNQDQPLPNLANIASIEDIEYLLTVTQNFQNHLPVAPDIGDEP